MSLPEEVVQIPITRLRAFPEHPFYVRDDDMMQQLVESVRQVGVLMPIIVRGSEDGFYEIISGHRRKHACELLKFEYVPAIVKDVDLNEATIMMVDTPYAFSITEDGQTLSVDMSNTKITGKLVISKVDADTQKLLPDAGFRIYAADGKTVLMEGRTDKKGVCEFELEFGKYFYQEFDAPDGYKIDDTKYEFSITEDGKIISVVMTNQAEEKKEDPKPTETPKPDDAVSISST